MRGFEIVIVALLLSVLNVDAACPAKLCDCTWDTPSFSVLGVGIGSYSLSVCTVLPSAVVDLYQDSVDGFNNLVDNSEDLINAAADLKVPLQNQLNAAVNDLNDIERFLGVDDIKEFFTDGSALNIVDDVVDSLESAAEGVVMALILPTELVKMFPELINNQNPDVVTDFIKERGEQILNWFTESLLNTAEGIGSQSCATCLYDNLNNGVIKFEIGADTGPGLSLTLHISSTRALECLVNSFAQLAVILHDSIPDGLEDGWNAVSEGLITSAEALATASKVVRESDFCNTEYVIPRTDFGTSTGVDVIDDFTEEIEKLVNIVGADGPFGKVVQTFSDNICTATNFEEFTNFADSLKQFLEIVSFQSIENKILKGLFSVINRMSDSLGTFRLMNFDVDTSTCNPNNRACALAIRYGSDYVQCIQGIIERKELILSLTLSFGENWVPPGVVGFGGSIGCANLDCVKCVFGIDNAGITIADTLQFLKSEILQFSSSDNKGNQDTCDEVLDCSGRGTFDPEVCACRCNNGFIAGPNGCIQCPTVNGQICNNNGACYIAEDGPKCCCLNGLTTPDCT